MNVEQRKPRSITSLCSSLGYSRQGLYKAQQTQIQQCFEEELIIQQVNKIREHQPRIGGRRLHYMLQTFMQEHQLKMGRDGLFKLLFDYGLLVRRRKRNKPITTHSFHRYKKYKNLIKEFIPISSNQLWVSDITYITLKNGFAYLSLITDAYSRKIVGFYLSKTLEAAGSIKALKMALQNNPLQENLIHHSDRGVQYCCNDYITILKNRKIKISMTENGDPLENAIAERVNGILKDELLQAVYTDFAIAQNEIAKAISVYNHLRPHSSISYKTPVEVHLNSQEKVERKWKNYYTPKEQVKVEVAYE